MRVKLDKLAGRKRKEQNHDGREAKARIAPKSLWHKLREYSCLDIEDALRRIVSNGKLVDCDDDIADRIKYIKDAADLCAAVREFTYFMLEDSEERLRHEG